MTNKSKINYKIYEI